MTPIGRRTVLKAGIGLGVGLGLGARSAEGRDDPASMRAQEGDLLVRSGDTTKKPLTADDIIPDSRPTMAWTMDPTDGTVRSGSRLNQVLLVRLDAEKLTAETRSRAADGVVAYTAICTHEGCPVDDWLRDAQVLHCPCHGSKFDPTDSARVLEGEAPRPLPALPLKLEERRLLVAGPFTTRVGFGSPEGGM